MLAVGQRHGARHDGSGHSRLSKWERRLTETTDEVRDPGQSRTSTGSQRKTQATEAGANQRGAGWGFPEQTAGGRRKEKKQLLRARWERAGAPGSAPKAVRRSGGEGTRENPTRLTLLEQGPREGLERGELKER